MKEEWFNVAMAVTAEIPFRIKAESLEDASLKSLELAKEQFPGAVAIKIISIDSEN